MNRLFVPLGLLAASLLLYACPGETQTPVGPSRKPERVPEQAKQDEPAPVTRGEASLPASLLQDLKADLVRQKGVSAEAVTVVSAEPVVWPNGALGCPQPGETVTQAHVPGYRVILEANHERYEYHAAERGDFRLCSNENGPRRRVPSAGR